MMDRKCVKCGATLTDQWRDSCPACDMRSPKEKAADRLDWWLQLLQSSEEGSGTQAIAKRMVAKYSRMASGKGQAEDT